VSIESRTPLLDYRIAEFLARPPAEQKVRGRVPKFLLREVGRPQLPGDRGPARRDPAPLAARRVARRAAGRACAAHPRLPALRRREILAPRSLAGHGFRLGRGWAALSLEPWFRIFIDGELAVIPKDVVHT
jgi:hypothetical protein